jgi:ATP-dependent Clp protease ATP-binding subunit ClpC
MEDDELLAKYCRDIGKMALPPEPAPDTTAMGDVRRLARDILDRKSVVIAGPPGVGKTMLVHQLVATARRGLTIPELGEVQFWEGSCTSLMAGTRYIGEWESKVFNLIKALGRQSVLYLTDVWNMLGTGSYHGSPKDLYDSFKTQAERGDIVLMGEMTEERLQAVTAREPTFLQLFSVHRLREPAENEVKQVLDVRARALGKKHKIEVGAESVDRVHALTRRFIPYEVFPGKAVRLLERVFAETALVAGRRTISPKTVWEIFSRQTGLPLWILDDGQPMDLERARAFFQSRVIGQDEAVSTVIDTIALYKARLHDPTKPIGVFFFVGPTGVGKTELAKALAHYLFGSPDRMVRLDMSEYITYDSLEKLLGKKKAGPDLSFSDQGLLTGKVREQPFSVVLLDEFEKAHSLVYDLMLQVFSDGRLTDARGETTDFRNTIIVLTSNVGTSKMGEIGFGGKAPSVKNLEHKVRREMESHFRPEFINRLDHVVVFRPLDEETMRRIARRELTRLGELDGVRDQKQVLEVDEAALDLLVRRGFDRKFGARPLKRAIKQLITTPLARLLVTKPPTPRQIVRVLARGDQMILDLESTEESVKARALDDKLQIEDAASGRPVRMTVKEVAASIDRILARIEQAERAFGVAEAEARVAQIEQLRARPDFWNDPVESARLLHRYHRLVGELKRFRDARDLARTVFESTELTVKEKDPSLLKDISHEYHRLLALTDKLELESTLFTEQERRDAFIVVTTAGVGNTDRRWVEELASVYERWARTKAYKFTLLYRAPKDAKPEEIAMKALIEGTYAYGYLAGEEGLHRLVRRPAGGGRQETETIAARVDVQPLLRTEDPVEPLAKRDPLVDRVTLGGGRSTRSGTRVRLVEAGAELVMLNTLSEVENHELAAWILRSMVTLRRPADAEAVGLVRSYDTAENMVVKDKRTGLTVHNLRKVFAGEIDEFLVAYLRERQPAEARAG